VVPLIEFGRSESEQNTAVVSPAMAGVAAMVNGVALGVGMGVGVLLAPVWM
jgi:hypothetical protein